MEKAIGGWSYLSHAFFYSTGDTLENNNNNHHHEICLNNSTIFLWLAVCYVHKSLSSFNLLYVFVIYLFGLYIIISVHVSISVFSVFLPFFIFFWQVKLKEEKHLQIKYKAKLQNNRQEGKKVSVHKWNNINVLKYVLFQKWTLKDEEELNKACFGVVDFVNIEMVNKQTNNNSYMLEFETM